MTRQKIAKACRSALPAVLMMFGTGAMLFSAAALTPAFADVQQGQSQVTGMVTDQDKQPLIGVTVTVVGTSTVAITDADGMFRISVPSKGQLEFSYMGFKKKQVKVRLNGAEKKYDLSKENDLDKDIEVLILTVLKDYPYLLV